MNCSLLLEYLQQKAGIPEGMSARISKLHVHVCPSGLLRGKRSMRGHSLCSRELTQLLRQAARAFPASGAALPGSSTDAPVGVAYTAHWLVAAGTGA